MGSQLRRFIVRTLFCAALVSSTALPLSAQSRGTDDYLELGRVYTFWLYERDFEGLWERFLPEMRQALGSIESMDAVKSQIVEQVGVEVELLEETVTDAEGYHVYLRYARYDGFEGRILVQFAMDDDGRIGGFYVRPAPGGS